MAASLAVLGGEALYNGPWPKWPNVDRFTEECLLSAFKCGQWTVSAPKARASAWEPRFARAFAEFSEVDYAVPMSNGTSALVAALSAAGVRAGSEVVIPAVGWVACASAVVAIGAVPVLGDIDPQTLCISPSTVRRVIRSSTTAVIVVHQNCAVSDVEGLAELASGHGCALIEDCSHAHGARIQGRRVGSYGDVGVFSLQQNKLLTCGEGGIAITNSPDVYLRLQQIRANGRAYPVESSSGELLDVGAVMGTNSVMAEMPAAIAYAQLHSLEKLNAQRASAAQFLDNALTTLDGVKPIRCDVPNVDRSYHLYTFKVDRVVFC